jgi:hypothetical protein
LKYCSIGYKQVFVVTDGSKITKDLRYDRVCVFVDEDGKVAHVPKPGYVNYVDVYEIKNNLM